MAPLTHDGSRLLVIQQIGFFKQENLGPPPPMDIGWSHSYNSNILWNENNIALEYNITCTRS